MNPKFFPTLTRMGLLETALGEYHLACRRLESAREVFKEQGVLSDLEYLNFWLNEFIFRSAVEIAHHNTGEQTQYHSPIFQTRAIRDCTNAGKKDVECAKTDIGFLKKILKGENIPPTDDLYSDVCRFEEACRELERDIEARQSALDEEEGIPFSVMISLTEKCHGGCRGCFAPCFDEPELDVKELTKIFYAMRRLGVKRVSFGGGEPTLRPDLPEILRAAKKTGLVTSMSTNGMHLVRNPHELKIWEDDLDEIIVDFHSTSADIASKFSPYMDQNHLSKALELFKYTLRNTKIQLKVATIMFKETSELEELRRTAEVLCSHNVRLWKIDQYYKIPDTRRKDVTEEELIELLIPDDVYWSNIIMLQREYGNRLKIFGIDVKFKRTQKNFMISPAGEAFTNNEYHTKKLGKFLELLKKPTDLLPGFHTRLPKENYEILKPNSPGNSP
jgi:MoaA/NifB/PqqE/SkfB family radical SAM enzyme